MLNKRLLNTALRKRKTIEYVGGTIKWRPGTASTSLTQTFDLKGGADTLPEQDDLVLITIAVGSKSGYANLDLTSQGYTHVGVNNSNGMSYDTTMLVAYKFMGPTPDTSIQIPASGNGENAQIWGIQCFRNIDKIIPIEDHAGMNYASSSLPSTPNPPSVSPTTPGACIVVCGSAASKKGDKYNPPEGFDINFLTGSSPDTADIALGVGYRLGWVSDIVDPPVFGNGPRSLGISCASRTLVLRPGR